MSDPKLRPGTNFCKCSVCNEYFSSPTPFSMHRTGSYTTEDRRCLNSQEMEDLGMHKDDRSYWHKSRRPVASLPTSPEPS